MLAYLDAEADIAEEAADNEEPVLNEALATPQHMDLDNNDMGMEGFLEGNDLVEPEVTHLQVGMARTHFVPISEDMQNNYVL
jgi:hypothetical protein